MLGAIIGDIVGSPYEFHNIKRKDFPLFKVSSHFTDDTMMTLANAKWLTEDITHSPEKLVKLMREIGRSHPYIGYGPTFLKWLYVPDEFAKPYNSWGNGAGMRVSPVGMYAQSMDECLSLAKISAEVTHNHPEGIKGAQAIAASVFLVRESGDAFSEETKARVKSFVEEPHTGVTGENRGLLLNLTDKAAAPTRSSILSMSSEDPGRIMKEVSLAVKSAGAQLELFPDLAAPAPAASGNTGNVTGGMIDGMIIEENSRNLTMPARHHLEAEDVDLKRLGAVLATAYESQNKDFEGLLLTPGLGPRTLQSLALVSEVIYGTPSRFRDPARFSFAHGGKDGHPFPVPTRIYDESIRILGDAVEKSRMGYKDKSDCLRRLHQTALEIEANCSPEADFEKTIEYEKAHSREWGGRMVGGCA